MAAILGLDESRVTEVCAEIATTHGTVQVANDNCPGQIVISGSEQGMDAALDALDAAGARRVVPLAVSIAAHSPLMAPAAEALRAAIDATPIAEPKLPVIANTSAQPLTSIEAIRAELSAQLTASVRWAASMRYAVDAGATQFVELGSGDVLTGLMRRINRKVDRLTVNDAEGVRKLALRMVR